MLRAVKEWIWKKERAGLKRDITLCGMRFSYTRKDLRKNVGIDAAALTPRIQAFTDWGLSAEARSPRLIVSLTSFPPRMHEVHFTLYSLLTQTLKPDMLILWLAEEDFPGKERDIPEAVLALRKNGLTIRWRENNIRSYLKLIPALQEYPEDIIVTTDDDVFYYPDCLEGLWKSWRANPSAIHAYRTPRLCFDEAWNLIDWKKDKTFLPSCLNGVTGSHGALYGPHMLHSDAVKAERFMQLIPTDDDTWFWAMACLQGTPIQRVRDDPLRETLCNNIARREGRTDEPTLIRVNLADGGLPRRWKILRSAYPQLVEILRGEMQRNAG